MYLWFGIYIIHTTYIYIPDIHKILMDIFRNSRVVAVLIIYIGFFGVGGWDIVDLDMYEYNIGICV